MLKRSSKALSLVAVLLLLPTQLFAAGGGSASPMVLVADTRKFSGLEAWWGGLYNEGHALFAVITCIIIPVFGAFLGVLADVWVLI
jgi:hypothetical protein